MARTFKMPCLLQTPENIMASLYEILSLRKTSNAAQTENRLFVTKIIKPNGARVLSTVFVKTSEIVMISDTRSCLKIGATKISCVLDKGYNSHAAFLKLRSPGFHPISPRSGCMGGDFGLFAWGGADK